MQFLWATVNLIPKSDGVSSVNIFTHSDSKKPGIKLSLFFAIIGVRSSNGGGGRRAANNRFSETTRRSKCSFIKILIGDFVSFW